MSKTKLRVHGGGFYGSPCTSGLNKNNFVEWVTEPNLSKISIHVDNGIFQPLETNNMNFGWILESSSIVPSVIRKVFSNLKFYKTKFKYIFAHDRRIVSKDPSFFKFVLPNARPWIQNKKIYQKSKITSFIASNKVMCRGHRYRQQVIKETIGKVEHFGSGFQGKELPAFIEENSIKDTGKLLGLKDYMFSIAMENDNYPDIFCEKITDCFATGTIPIYWGTPNIANYFDINGIILLQDVQDFSSLNKDLYDSKKESIINNFNLCKDLPTAEDYMFKNYIEELL
tara:strand:+ start:6587 stop:7438 length:852 start_codon:yes stop_codon:yes gene_type:complete